MAQDQQTPPGQVAPGQAPPGGAPPDSGGVETKFAELIQREVKSHFTAALNGIQTNVQKTIADQIDKVQKDQKAALEELKKMLAETAEGAKPSGRPGAKDGKDPAFELSEQRKKNEELETSLAKIRADLEAAKQAGKQKDIRVAVKDALVAEKCIDPNLAILWLESKGILDVQEDGTVVANVKNDYGVGAISVKEYIQKHAKAEIGHLFEGSSRGGSPASGDHSGSRAWKYSWEDFQRSEFYEKNMAEMDAALERGEVRNLPQKVQDSISRRPRVGAV